MSLRQVFVADNELRIAQLEKGLTVCVPAFSVDEQNEVHFVSYNLHLLILIIAFGEHY